ncbi:uncharacterized protein LOC119348771 [Triticum dicoccoides]|uniref:uncharacterized protein LOC119348771 n=1 Tax=Triticum dicoccoides TaxID=85692 RepID=UPI00188F79F4|nr:uncharacterized protein LOC119348771 [Triticum dicoccoides]
MMYGHGIKGMDFFHIELPDLPPPSPSLQAIVTIREGVASPEMLEAELNHLYHCTWDWQVTMMDGNQFSVIFPNTASHGYGTRSGDITLALNKLVVDISVPTRDPLAVAVLDTALLMLCSNGLVTCSFGGRLAAPGRETPSPPSSPSFARWLSAWHRRFPHHHLS